MIKLLDIFLDTKQQHRMVLYTKAQDLEHTVLLSTMKIMYRGTFGSFTLLSGESFLSSVYGVRLKLNQLVNNQLLLDNSICKPLGYYASQLNQKEKRKHFKYIKNPETGHTYWVGYTYELFCPQCLSSISSWLYNDVQGNGVLEVSPVYPWHFRAPDAREKYTTYSKWMTFYTTYALVPISSTVAAKELLKLDQLISTVEQNNEHFVQHKLKIVPQAHHESQKDQYISITKRIAKPYGIRT